MSSANHFINPDFIRPQLSTKFYRMNYNYLRRFYSEKVFDEICAELKMPKSYLLADDNWVSVEFGRKFARLVRQKTNDPEIYRKFGHFLFDPQNINPIEFNLLKSLSPFGYIKAFSNNFKRGNQACAATITSTDRGTYNFHFQAIGEPIYVDMALNIVGAFESLEKIYGLKSFKLSVETHLIPGEDITEFKFTMHFAAIRYFIDIAVKALSVLGTGAALTYLIFHLESFFNIKALPVVTFFAAAVSFFLLKTYRSLSVMKANVEDYYKNGREKNMQLYEKSEMLERRYQEANLLRELSTELVTIKDPQRVLHVCLDSLKSKFSYNQIALFQVSRKRQKLYLSENRGFEEVTSRVGDIEFDFPNPKAKEGFFSAILETGESALISDIQTYKTSLKEKNRKLLEMLRVGSMVVCPIQTPGEKFGLIAVFRTAEEEALTQTDQFLLEKVANFLALYLDNAANFSKEQGLRKLFQQYVPAVVLEEFVREGSTAVNTEPKRTEIISVFIDLRDFTSLSEQLSPERVVKIISRYADFVSSVFSAQGAVIDNIVGDAVVMFFPCSTDIKGDLIKLFLAFSELNKNWAALKESMGHLGLKDFKLGVGAHVGPALVGNVGGSLKRNYTALGDTVNVASRLQSISKKFSAQLGNGELTVVVSSDILERLHYRDAEVHSEQLRGRHVATAFSVLNEEIIEKILNPQVIEIKKAG